MARAAMVETLADETGLPLSDLLNLRDEELDALLWDYPGAAVDAVAQAHECPMDLGEPEPFVDHVTLRELLNEQPEPNTWELVQRMMDEREAER